MSIEYRDNMSDGWIELLILDSRYTKNIETLACSENPTTLIYPVVCDH